MMMKRIRDDDDDVDDRHDDDDDESWPVHTYQANHKMWPWKPLHLLE